MLIWFLIVRKPAGVNYFLWSVGVRRGTRRSSVVPTSEFKSEVPGFDPLVGQGEGECFCPSESTLVQTCLSVAAYSAFQIQYSYWHQGLLTLTDQKTAYPNTKPQKADTVPRRLFVPKNEISRTPYTYQTNKVTATKDYWHSGSDFTAFPNHWTPSTKSRMDIPTTICPKDRDEQLILD